MVLSSHIICVKMSHHYLICKIFDDIQKSLQECVLMLKNPLEAHAFIQRFESQAAETVDKHHCTCRISK